MPRVCLGEVAASPWCLRQGQRLHCLWPQSPSDHPGSLAGPLHVDDGSKPNHLRLMLLLDGSHICGVEDWVRTTSAQLGLGLGEPLP